LRYRIINSEKIKDELHWNYKINLNSGLQKTITHYLNLKKIQHV